MTTKEKIRMAKRRTPGTVEQPLPTRGRGPAIWDLVRKDLDKMQKVMHGLGLRHPSQVLAIWRRVAKDSIERDRLGEARYGRRLRAHDGRNHLVDAYQEALDLVVYLRADMAKRKKVMKDYDDDDVVRAYVQALALAGFVRSTIDQRRRAAGRQKRAK